MKKILNLFPLSKWELVQALAVFIIYFATAKFGLYFYYSFDTSPALIWPAVGISLISILYGGHKMWFSIFLAQYLALVTQIPDVHITSLIIAAAFTLQALVGFSVAHAFRSRLDVSHLHNTLALMTVAFGVTLIEPTIVTLVQAYMGTLTVPPFFSFARAWGGGIFSVLVIVPIITTWHPWQKKIFPPTTFNKLELVGSFILLMLLNYMLFWTPYPALFGISVIFFLPVLLMWFVLRLHPRWLTLAISLTAVSAISGALIENPVLVPINQQLLNIEVYISMVAAIFLVFASVVEKRRINYQELKQSYLSAAAAEQAQNEFIAILAHELRNPLAPVISAVELLKLQDQNSESMSLIQTAEGHLIMVRRLLDNLLETARLSQNKIELRKEIFNLKDIIDLSVGSVEDLIRARRHNFTIDIPPRDIPIHADPVRIKQVLINLLNNAFKYTDHGGKIKLSIHEDSEYILIQIEDNGRGIAREEISNIFKPFRQTRGTVSRAMGLGLGLYIAKNIVELHQGRIRVESDGPGLGSIFNVYLPRPSNEVLSAQSENNEQAPTHIEPTTILVVDDNQSAADTLGKLLTHYGHKVKTIYSGREALEIIDTFNPEIILLDIGMPEMDGIEVAKKIRVSSWRGILIALSGYGQESDKKATQEAGFNHHLVKPVRVKDLLELISQLKAR